MTRFLLMFGKLKRDTMLYSHAGHFANLRVAVSSKPSISKLMRPYSRASLCLFARKKT